VALQEDFVNAQPVKMFEALSGHAKRADYSIWMTRASAASAKKRTNTNWPAVLPNDGQA